MLMTGMMLQDRYEVLERIGSGGMSDVYKAKCHKLNRLVAIKVLKSEFTSDAGFVSKFKMEAQAAAGLSHPNIVNVYDVVDEGELHYIVMELIEGITLKSYIVKKGHLDVKESIGIAIQVAQGIEAAHEQHIVHRDIKPQNMLISRDGKVKVADFGIARAVSSQTMNSTVVGSVHYISPEQARGGYSDGRSDIYSLGITLYEMVTGRVPFEGDNTVTVALAHLEDPITLPSTYNSEITPSLDRIILKCTEKRPDNRYQNVGEMISDLRRALLNPDDPLIGADEDRQDHMSQTITIGQKELDIIKTHSQKIHDSRPVKEIREHRERRDLERRYPQEPVQERPGRDKNDRPAGNRGKMRDESSQLEKVLTALGVIVAIIVVAVVLVFFSRLGGVFNKGTDRTTAASSTEESTSNEETTEPGLSQKEVRMPSLVGDTQDEAEAKLKALDLVMQVEQENSDDVEKGLVISQADEPDSVVARYSKVTVVVSAGSDKVDLASLGITDMTLDTAVRLLEGKGLKPAVVEEASETVIKGSIIRFTPEDKAALGETVTLYVSTGPKVETVPVPALTGKTEEEAIGLLEAAGLVPGEVTQANDSSIPKGSIISQGIGAEEQVEIGSAVDYVVSLGPETPKTEFLASLEASYPLMVNYGPGAAGAEIQVMIRLKQRVNGEDRYVKLTDPKTYSTSTTLDIRFTRIKGAYGVTTGEVEIVDITNNVILTSYNVNFVEFEVN